jgi:hypothetical protein
MLSWRRRFLWFPVLRVDDVLLLLLQEEEEEEEEEEQSIHSLTH